MQVGKAARLVGHLTPEPFHCQKIVKSLPRRARLVVCQEENLCRQVRDPGVDDAAVFFAYDFQEVERVVQVGELVLETLRAMHSFECRRIFFTEGPDFHTIAPGGTTLHAAWR